VPAAFGLAKTRVSRRFIRTSARALRQLTERRLDDAEWLVLVLDGKTFAQDAIVIALGVTRTGEKRLLGLVQTASENKRVCARLSRGGARRLRRCARPAMSVAQAGECRELPAAVRTRGVAP